MPKRLLLLVAIGALVVTAGATSAAAAHIKPGQHFVGVVNGTKPTAADLPDVYTVCAGPASPGQTGPLVSGQTLEVVAAANGPGYTGVFNTINAWFEQDASSDGPVQITFTRYGTARLIPRTVRVPCDGTGQVTFSSCPRLAPCAAGWIATSVTVRFVNIAA